MAETVIGTHELLAALPKEVRDFHRAIASLKEELEAVDWYHQRAAACTDGELRGILVHNRNEELEHAMMLLEWLRRRNASVDEKVRKYLFNPGPILGPEDRPASATGGTADAPVHPDLGIGGLKEKGGAWTS